jgi:uncharacterized protein
VTKQLRELFRRKLRFLLQDSMNRRDVGSSERALRLGDLPVVSYFLLTFAISWLGALSVALPALSRGPIPTLTGVLMFPAMLLGPLLSGISMNYLMDGKTAVSHLFHRILRARVGLRWYAVLLIPPLLIALLLLFLARFVSPTFAPNHFFFGIAFGVPAGICEEIGWTGFAFPKMCKQASALKSAVILGMIWGLWHLPVINFLGAAAPHGSYWLRFFFAFTFVMTAMRVIISWLYVNTGSVVMAQLLHVSSTGALVVFSPHVSAGHEAMWYAVYGSVLWIVVATIVSINGAQLGLNTGNA